MTPDPRQAAYAATRAAWERDVWPAIAERIARWIESVENQKKESGNGR